MWKKHKRFWKKANDLFSRLHTLVNDIVFLGHPGDVGIGGDAEVAGWLWGASAHDTSGYSNVLNKLTRAVGKDYITAEPESSAVLPWLHLQQRQPAPGPAIPSWWSKSEHPADTLWRTTPPQKEYLFKARFSLPTRYTGGSLSTHRGRTQFDLSNRSRLWCVM